MKKEKSQKRKNAPLTLHDPDIFFSSIVENIPDMIFIKEAQELRFVHFNKAGEDLLGHERKDLIGKNDYDFFSKPEADFFTQKDREVLQSGLIFDIAEEPIHTKKKGLRYLHTKKIPIVDSNKQPLYLLGISRDVTELKLARERMTHLVDELEQRVAERTEHLHQSNIKLAHLSRVSSEFATMVAHELRTPLSVVKEGVSQILDELDGPINAEQKQTLEIVKNNTERLARLILNVLEFQKMDSGMQPPVIKPHSLKQMTHQAVATMAKIAERKGVRLELMTPKTDVDVDYFLDCDEDKIQQLLINLIDNALKFTFAGGKVVLAYQIEGEELHLTISDTGIGIKEEDRESIFQMFHQGNHNEAWRSGGYGVGLAVCKRIVDMHHGKIDIQSGSETGTQFTITLPLKI